MEKVKKNIAIDQLIREINDVMPKYQIFKNDILHPTPDGVFKFYSHFWGQLEERLNEFKFDETPEYLNAQELDPFEEIFLKMSLIFKPQVFYFTLEDIYEPQTIRTKYLFKLCVHFLVFIDNIDDDVKQSFKNLTEICDKISLVPKENEELIIKKQECGAILSKLKDENRRVYQIYIDTVHLHEELEEQQNQRKKLHNAKLKQAINLKTELDTKTHKLNQLKKQETHLSEQLVIPEEYKNLQTTLANLEKEMSSVSNERTEYENILEQNHTRFCKYQEALQIILNYSEIDISFLNRLMEHEQQLRKVTIQNDSMSKHLKTLNVEKEQYCKNEEELEMIRNRLMDKLRETANGNLIQLEVELNRWQTDLKQKHQDKIESSNKLEIIALARIRLNKTIFELNAVAIELDRRGMELLEQYLTFGNRENE